MIINIIYALEEIFQCDEQNMYVHQLPILKGFCSFDLLSKVESGCNAKVDDEADEN